MASLYKDPQKRHLRHSSFLTYAGVRRTLRTGVRDQPGGGAYPVWHVDNLLAARRAAVPLPAATAEWLGRIDAEFRAKLETLGLAEPRAERRVPTLGELIDEFLENRKPQVKPQTLPILHCVVRRLLTCLPENTPIDQITPADADRGASSVQRASWRSPQRTDTSQRCGLFSTSPASGSTSPKTRSGTSEGCSVIGDSKRRAIHPDKASAATSGKNPRPRVATGHCAGSLVRLEDTVGNSRNCDGGTYSGKRTASLSAHRKPSTMQARASVCPNFSP
jgi:hypothetical protein